MLVTPSGMVTVVAQDLTAVCFLITSHHYFISFITRVAPQLLSDVKVELFIKKLDTKKELSEA